MLDSADAVTQGEAYGLILAGVFLLAGLVAHVVGRRVHVPRATLLMLIGFLAGPSVFNLITPDAADWFPLAAHVALSMVGFQLGEQFLGEKLRQTATRVLVVSLAEVTVVAAAVGVTLLLGGVSLPMALLLAGLAPATAPISTLDIVRETGAQGPVTETLLGVVSINNAWTVLLFSMLVAVAQAVGGQGVSTGAVLEGMWEVAGGVLLGAAVGLPMAWLTGRMRPGELTVVETLGFVFLCSGLAIWLGLSYLLACMAMGATVSNFATHHERPFHAIEEVEQPFLIVFFLLAGFHFEIRTLWRFVTVVALYVGARSAGLIGGGMIGGALAGAPPAVRTHMGWCLLPQAGMALGLALKASEQSSEIGSQVLSIVVATTVVLEFLGPILARAALRHAGEIPQDEPVLGEGRANR